jgi:hypothetical protein
MRSVRSLAVVVVTTVLMLSVLASSAAGSSQKSFHLMKTCSSEVLCTVLWSSFKEIPPGTKITYVNDFANGLTYPSIVTRNGSTTGVCNWNQPSGSVLAKCTLGTGTGRLTQFHLAVDVTATSDLSFWFWDGTYWMGGGD